MPGACEPSMTKARAWVRLPSGKRLDLLNPTPFDWEDKDLALALPGPIAGGTLGLAFAAVGGAAFAFSSCLAPAPVSRRRQWPSGTARIAA